jgi:hypothetical protein
LFSCKGKQHIGAKFGIFQERAINGLPQVIVVIVHELIPDGNKLFLPSFAVFLQHAFNQQHTISFKQGEMTMSTLVEGVSHQVI